jgi:peptidoglycan hydrolase-like protein with peptidoglycan-binding domain
MYNINEQLISSNRSYTAFTPQGMVVHCTDTPGDSDELERTAFNNHPEFRASAHAFIDSDSKTQCVPTNEKAWHGGPTANSLYLGVELCMANNAVEFQEIWNRAVWLFANWMKNVVHINTITTDNLLSHAEVSERWGETDHMDPVSYFAKYGKTVDMFRAEVQAAMNGQTYSPTPVNTPSATNDDINLQRIMNRFKMKDGKGNTLEEDGIIGRCTKEAVKRFQSICALEVDGVAGPKTWEVIAKIMAKPLLDVGCKGPVVRYLQYRVDCTHDGIFGWDTNRHVAIWQGQNFCSQDGIVGSQTWNRMIG